MQLSLFDSRGCGTQPQRDSTSEQGSRFVGLKSGVVMGSWLIDVGVYVCVSITTGQSLTPEGRQWFYGLYMSARIPHQTLFDYVIVEWIS